MSPSTHRMQVPLAARISGIVGLSLVLTLALPATASAAVSSSYAFSGYEVWATSTVGTFAGTATGSSGDHAAWKAAIQHTVATIPVGYITGGYAQLLTSDLTTIRGTFSGGQLRLIDDGEGICGNLTHKVRGTLTDVVRSDTGAVGTGLFTGRLVHYRVQILGSCIAYSASARGTISLYF
jgi:hypothetical protein